MKYYYFLIILVSITAFSQQRNSYKVRLMAKEVGAFPLKVINTTSNESVLSDNAGFLTMNLNEGDEVVVNENDFYQLKYKIKNTDLKASIVRIYLEPINTELSTVEVQKITAKSLGVDGKTIMSNTPNPNPNMNMDFKAIFLWIVGKIRGEKSEPFVPRKSTEMNPYVAGLPRDIMTDYLKIPDELVEKFYYYMNDDYEIDSYIKQNDEAKWRMHLLDKSFQFLEQENVLPNR